MATPFDEDGGLDLPSLRRMSEAYVDMGVDGLVVLGIMGEAPKLDSSESMAVVSEVLAAANGRAPVVVGVSSPGFAAMGNLARGAMDAGAAAVMVAPVPTLRSDQQIVGYFDDVVETIGTDTPFVLQDYPQTTNVVMPVSALMAIADRHPSCVMLKHEDWPGLDKISAIREAEKTRDRRWSILCGNGGLFLPFEMERGADGAMTGYAFPEMLLDVVRLSKQGSRTEAHDLFDLHLPLVRYETQPNLGLAVRKYVLKTRGLITSDRLRKPGPKLTAATRAEIDWMLSRIEAGVRS